MKSLFIVFGFFSTIGLIAQNPDNFVDGRDSMTYKVVGIGKQVWFAENLNYDADKNTLGKSWCFDFIKENCKTYGRLYSFEAAQKACPKGWHLPDDNEWKEMEWQLGMSKSETDKINWRGKNEASEIKTKTDWTDTNNEKNNSTGFSALPGGFYFNAGGFEDINKCAYWWTSTIDNMGAPLIHFINYKLSKIGRGEGDMTMGLSVRCVKDK